MSTDADRQKALSRITKILNLAGNNPSEEEAARATEKAAEMALRWGISEAEIAIQQGHEDRVMVDHIQVSAKITDWRLTIASAITRNLGGRLVYVDNRRTPGGVLNGHIEFWGERGAVRAMVEIYHFIDLQLWSMSTTAMIEREVDAFGKYKVPGRTFRNSWLAGASSRIADRLRVVTETVERDSSTGTALVLLKDTVDAAFEETYPRLRRRSRRTQVKDRAAYTDGYVAASHVNIARPEVRRGSAGELAG